MEIVHCCSLLIARCPLVQSFEKLHLDIIGFGERLNAQIGQQSELLIWIAIAWLMQQLPAWQSVAEIEASF